MRPATSGVMAVRVRLFARARELAGASELALEVPRDADVREASRRLGEVHPALAPLLERCRFAVQESYAAPDYRLHEGDELAVIPPIGGG